ncbi:ExbD/TolR family protein [Caulobacter mirabilis]|uniref:Biopolymer transporter ExbD n=1 Tax=Caulobacter mirabilis TaxID=69666 RepID=A0A2D2AUX5_9CAUL|nr:biopolymer transporter ExbD [Caulobacter mirabilis]ATQ41791.1 hypothetical protein CSW64_04880 [Caulobacter mirabilis]
MLEGLLAALALLFAPAPQAEPEPYAAVEIDMPACTMPGSDRVPSPPLFVHVVADGRLIVRGGRAETSQEVVLKGVGEALRERALREDGGYQRIFLRADDDVSYASVVKVMSTLRHNGFDKIGLIYEGGR